MSSKNESDKINNDINWRRVITLGIGILVGFLFWSEYSISKKDTDVSFLHDQIVKLHIEMSELIIDKRWAEGQLEAIQGSLNILEKRISRAEAELSKFEDEVNNNRLKVCQ
jgi:hypothetical protein